MAKSQLFSFPSSPDDSTGLYSVRKVCSHHAKDWEPTKMKNVLFWCLELCDPNLTLLFKFSIQINKCTLKLTSSNKYKWRWPQEFSPRPPTINLDMKVKITCIMDELPGVLTTSVSPPPPRFVRALAQRGISNGGPYGVIFQENGVDWKSDKTPDRKRTRSNLHPPIARQKWG